MSTGPRLSRIAQIVLRSLKDHPDLRTPGAIANGPYGINQLDSRDMLKGLQELENHLLAVQMPDASWQATEQGLARETD
jgi:hypothetical protein